VFKSSRPAGEQVPFKRT